MARPEDKERRQRRIQEKRRYDKQGRRRSERKPRPFIMNRAEGDMECGLL